MLTAQRNSVRLLCTGGCCHCCCLVVLTAGAVKSLMEEVEDLRRSNTEQAERCQTLEQQLLEAQEQQVRPPQPLLSSALQTVRSADVWAADCAGCADCADCADCRRLKTRSMQ